MADSHAASNAYPIFKSRVPGATLSLCVCSKCGGSSVYREFFGAVTGMDTVDQIQSYETLTGKRWDIKSPRTWRLPNVTEWPHHLGNASSSLHIIVQRDPADRYISSFFSKIACCPRLASDDSTDRRPCYKDTSDKMATDVARLGGLAVREPRCLFFPEFVGALRSVHQRGKQHELNRHFVPQTLACPALRKTPLLITNAGEFGTVLAGVRGAFRLNHIPPMPHVHTSPRNESFLDAASLRALAALAAPELDAQRQCTAVVELPLASASTLHSGCYRPRFAVREPVHLD